MKLSLVVPCYNEAENVELFYNAVSTAFSKCDYDYEIVFVDDGSADATLHQLKKLLNDDICGVKIISLTRNFGKEAAMYAGIANADGDYISLIDADLQQHPDTVRQMVEILDSDPSYDVVAAYQDRRNEGKLLSFFKRTFYKLINALSDVHVRSDASDFRTFRCSVADSILSLGESHRFSKGIFAWVGYKTCFVPYQAGKRIHGATKWSFRKLTNYAIEGITGYSRKPLRIATFLGGLTAAAAIIYMLVVVIQKLFIGIDVPGYATIIVLILALGSMQLICIGLIGEYVGRIFEQSKNRPIYLTKEILANKKEDA